MGYASKKINKEYLNRQVSEERVSKYKYAGDYEVYGRACMYLDMQDKSIEAFKRAAELQDDLIERIRKGKAVGDEVKEVHRKANFLRLAGEVEESKKVYIQAKEMYEELLESNKYPHNRVDYTSKYMSTLFMLKEYEKCLTFGDEWMDNYPAILSRAILNNDKELIGSVIERIKKHAKERKFGPGEESGGTIGIWDWYEIAMQLIGEPSRIDYIKW